MVDLSVVLPVFNEEKNIKLLVKNYLSISKKITLEVLFVEDGGSTDNTRKEIQKFANKHSFIKPVFTKERGYGISIFNGLKKAKGTYLCWTHADLQTDSKDVLKAFNLIKSSKSNRLLVKGKRYGRPIFDVIFTIGMSFIETLLFFKPFWDINAQPNIFHKSFLRKFENPPKDFSFDLYVYYLSKKNNFQIIRFPVHFGKRLFGNSAWNTGMRARFGFIKRTLKFSFELRKKL